MVTQVASRDKRGAGAELGSERSAGKLPWERDDSLAALSIQGGI